ncbi:MAG TPA: signal peptidase II [Nitrospirae bacterium]|nr:signal peptidase II [Nitrospirota bacterium]HDZ84054.1 signal peptidase II [Nitrospirota bacterium]HEW81266.1 signal peptidase II [Nitrospirota bacterium]
MKKSTLIALVSTLVMVLDYVTKRIILAKLAPYDRIEVFPFLNIVYVENKGAAFGMFANLGNNFFIGISVIALVVILVYMSKIPKGLELFSISLIFGGAVGNLINRIMIGKVTDFIDFYVGTWHWPAFNVADSALTIGIILFMLAAIMQSKKPSSGQ